MIVTNEEVLFKISELYRSLFNHDGYGEMRVEIKILKRGQKEVILHCGKQFRFLVDYRTEREVVSNKCPEIS